MFRAQKARTASDVRIANDDIGGHAIESAFALMRHNRTNRRINHRSAGRSAGVNAISRGRVLIDDVVIYSANENESVENLRAIFKMLANFDARNRGFNRIVSRTGNLFAVAFAFRVPGIDMSRAAAEPNENAMLGFAFGIIDFLFFLRSLKRPRER